MPELCTRLTTFPAASDPFREGEHTGLDFEYGTGRVRDDNQVIDVAGDSITLVDDDTNYIEVDPETGTVALGTGEFTAGHIPLYEVTTAGGEITEVHDRRCFFSVGVGTGPAPGIGFVSMDVAISDSDYVI